MNRERLHFHHVLLHPNNQEADVAVLEEVANCRSRREEKVFVFPITVTA